MKDMDALSHRFDRNVAVYFLQAIRIRHWNIVDRPAACSFDYFSQTPRPQKVLPTPSYILKSITSSLLDSSILSLRTVITLPHLYYTISVLSYPTYFTSPLRYISTTSAVTHLSLDTLLSSSAHRSHYDTHFPHV